MAEVQKTVKSFNGTVVGNPTIDFDTGVANNFSTGNYLTIPSSLGEIGNTFYYHIKTGSTPSSTIRLYTLEGFDAILMNSSNQVLLYSWSSQEFSTLATATNNTEYWIKVVTEVGQRKYYIALDGETYIGPMTITDTTYGPQPSGTFWFGNGANAEFWNGDIYINDCYVTDSNDIEIWRGVKTETYYGQTEKCYKNWPYLFGARGTGYWDSVITKNNITAGEDITLNMEVYNGLSNTQTPHTSTADIMNFSSTVLPWKFDYNRLLSTSKYCLMPTGMDYYGYETDEKELNVTVVGSPSINTSTFVASGFSTGNYLTVPSSLSTVGNTFYYHFKTGSTPSSTIRVYTLEAFDALLETSSRGLLVYSWSAQQITTLMTVSNNTEYWLRVKTSTGQRSYAISTDGTTYGAETVITDTTYGPQPSGTFYWGCYENSEFWNGSIYLNDCYVEDSNNVEIWRGTKYILGTLPGCTYNYIDDGAATTLNCFVVNGDESLVLTPNVSYFGHPKIGTVSIDVHSVYQYNDGTWQASAYLTGGKQYYIKAIGGGGGSSTWDGGAGAYWEGLYTPATTVSVNIGTGGAGVGAAAYSRRHNGGKGGNTYMTGTDVSIICEGGQGAIGLREGDETGNSSTYTYAPTINITNGTYNTIKASTHYRPRRVSWDDDTVTGYGAGGQAAGGTKLPGHAGVEGFLEYYEAYSIVILTTPVDLNPTIEWFDEDPELNPSATPVQIGGAYILPEDGTTIYLKVSKEGYQSYYNNYTNVGQNTSEVVTLEEEEEPQP